MKKALAIESDGQCAHAGEAVQQGAITGLFFFLIFEIERLRIAKQALYVSNVVSISVHY